MQKIYRSTVFDAPVDAVWAIMRDFNDWPSWLKIIATSEIEGGGPSDEVGAIRALVVPPSDAARERLEGLDDHAHTISYSIVETSSPPGIEDYLATIRLTPITDGDRTFAEWSGSFWCTDASTEQPIADGIAAMVYEGGFAGVRERLGG